jgi:hypothetical protein
MRFGPVVSAAFRRFDLVPVFRSLAVVVVLASPAAMFAQADGAFGSVPIGASATGTVTFSFTGSTAIASINVVTQGTPNLDFTLNAAAPGTCTATTYTSGTCTVGVNFTPLAAGPRAGAVVLRDSSSNVLSVVLLSGFGSGAAFVTSTGPIAEIPGGGSLNAVTDFVDAAGNVYVGATDPPLNKKITPAGVVSTVTVYNDEAVSIAADGAGYAYVLFNNSGDYFIIKVDQVTGAYTVVADGGNDTLPSIAVDSLGSLYVSDTYITAGGFCQIDKYSPNGSYSTINIPNCANYANGMAFDSANNLYWAALSGYIFKYSQATGITTTVNSGGTIAHPQSVAVDAAGNIYVANDTANLYMIAAGATSATVFASPAIGTIDGIAVDGAGDLYFGSSTYPGNMYKMDRTHPSASATGATAVGSHSSESTVTYVNDGDAASAITGSAIAAAIVGPSTTCTASNSVAVLGTCIVGIEFAPTVQGSPQSGTVTLTGAITSPVYTITGYVAGDPEKLGFGTAPPANITAGGNPGTVTVQVQDNGGALVTGNTTSITLQITGPGSYTFSCTVAAVNGTATFNLANTSTCSSAATLTTAGIYTYVASASGLTGTSTIEGVSAAATAHFTVIPSSTSVNDGVADTITVTSDDTYGNPTTGYTGTLKLTSTDAAAMLPPNFTLSNGKGTASVAFYTAGTQTVTATDTVTTSITGTSPSITVMAVPVFTVTTGVDDATGVSANCNDISGGGTPLGSCSLRDALAAVDAKGYTGATGTQPVIIVSQTALGYTSTNPVTLTLTSALSVAHNVNIAGPGANLLSISGNGKYRILAQTGSTTDTTVSGLTLTGGYSSTGSAFSGSVNATNTYNFTNVIVTGNTVPTGATGYGALYVALGTPTVNITASTFSNNQNLPGTTFAYGGAVYLGSGTLNITNSLFTGNAVSNTGTSEGGAVYLTKGIAFTITGSAFLNNIAGSASGTASIAYGGALFVSMNSGTNTGSITNTLFTANAASATGFTQGGAFYSLSGTYNITGSTFVNNSVTTPATNTTGNHLGGAIFNQGTLYLYNDTITANSAINPGGSAYNGGVDNADVAYAYNTVISGNTVTATTGTDKDEVNVTIYSSYIDTSTTSTCTTDCTPLLNALGNYGGGPIIGAPGGTTATTVAQATGASYLSYQNIATFTSIPLPGSPLLAAGSTAYLYSSTYTRPGTVVCNGTTTETEARGCAYPRTLTEAGATHVDIGAAEANYTLAFVTQPVDTTVNSPLLPPPTVQVYESGALFNATPSCPGATTGFCNSTAQPGSLALAAAAGTPSITSVTINANGLETLAPAFPAVESADSLIVSVNSGAATPVTVATQTSSTFNITASDTAPAGIGFINAPPPTIETGSNAGTVTVALLTSGSVNTSATALVTLIVTGPSSYSQTYTATPMNGIASFNLSAAALGTTGTYTYTATASSYTTYAADSAVTSETVGGYSVWVLDASGVLLKLSTAGALVSTAGVSGTSANYGGVAFDASGDVWSVTSATNSVIYTPTGSTTTSSYTGGGLNAPSAIALDGAGDVWIANSGNNTVSEFTSGRTAMSPTVGYGTSAALGAPSSIAIDLTGGVWIANKTGNSVTHVFGAATPVVSPLSNATATGTLDSKP